MRLVIGTKTLLYASLAMLSLSACSKDGGQSAGATSGSGAGRGRTGGTDQVTPVEFTLAGIDARRPGFTVRAVRLVEHDDAQPRHEHGAGTLVIVLDGRTGTIEFTAAAQSVYGFEREPRTAAEREQRAKSLIALRSRIADMVRLDEALGCSIIATAVHAGRDSHGHTTDESRHEHAFRDDRNRTHVDVHGEYALSCAKPLPGHVIRFGFTTVFPALHTVDVRVRVNNREHIGRIESDRGTITP